MNVLLLQLKNEFKLVPVVNISPHQIKSISISHLPAGCSSLGPAYLNGQPRVEKMRLISSLEKEQKPRETTPALGSHVCTCFINRNFLCP